MKKIVSMLLALSLLFSLPIYLISCGGEEENSLEPIDYTITVKTAGGMPLKDVRVIIYDEKNDVYKAFVNTNEYGLASASLPKSQNYTVMLDGIPEGYSYEESYSLTSENTAITLTSSLIADENLSGVSYSLGDVMHDFTILSSDSEILKLSDLLEEYDCVLLNFWFINCPYCIAEFPALDASSATYAKDAKVIAINPIDSPADAKEFKDTEELSFDVASDRTLASALGLRAYPVSVVIDRYGVICLIQEGALPQEEYFNIIFDTFTKDAYEQKLYSSINDIIASER